MAVVQTLHICAGSSYSYIYSKYLSMVRREPMRLLEVGMGCSIHGGVNGLNTLAVSLSSISLSVQCQMPALFAVATLRPALMGSA